MDEYPQFATGKTYNTRSGQAVLITGFNQGRIFPLTGIYKHNHRLGRWRADGSCYSWVKHENTNDLIMERS